jgi:hypothetical protein
VTPITVRSLGGTFVVNDVKVDKSKFDALLNAMLRTPPLPRSQVKTERRKPRKSRG